MIINASAFIFLAFCMACSLESSLQLPRWMSVGEYRPQVELLNLLPVVTLNEFLKVRE